ncbi:MAG: addiction module antidote protein [Chlamydiales bacterium]
MARSKSYQEELIKALKNHKEAAAYLNAALEECMDGDEESQELFLRALRNVAEAQGGLGKLAKKIHIRRENLYRILSEEGNPELRTLTTIMAALGFSLKVA